MRPAAVGGVNRYVSPSTQLWRKSVNWLPGADRASGRQRLREGLNPPLVAAIRTRRAGWPAGTAAGGVRT